MTVVGLDQRLIGFDDVRDVLEEIRQIIGVENGIAFVIEGNLQGLL